MYTIWAMESLPLSVCASLAFNGVATLTKAVHFRSNALCSLTAALTNASLLLNISLPFRMIMSLLIVLWLHLPNETQVSDPNTRPGPPQNLLDHPVSVPADGNCMYHCIAAAQDLGAWSRLGLREKELRSQTVRNDLIRMIIGAGDIDVAERLRRAEGIGPAVGAGLVFLRILQNCGCDSARSAPLASSGRRIQSLRAFRRPGVIGKWCRWVVRLKCCSVGGWGGGAKLIFALIF